MKENLSESPTSAAVGDTRHIKYVFVDVVGFSTDRSVEAQNDIVETLNGVCTQAFKDLFPEGEVIYIPTGDGICVAISDARAQYDAHLQFALTLLSRLEAHNQRIALSSKSTDYMRRFEVRIGISENVDNIVRDINGHKNVAGNGITTAQRVMALADGMQILLATNAYQTLHAHEKYMNVFRQFKAVVKHGQALDVYQFVQVDMIGLNTEIPSVFKNRELIEDQLEACLRENFSKGGQVRCVREAIERWEGEVPHRVNELIKQLPGDQRPLLEKAQRAWTRYRKAELDFAEAFYSKMRGSMWGPIRLDRHHGTIHERGRDLAMYLEMVDEQDVRDAEESK